MASKAGEPRVPVALQKSRLKAEEKILDLNFELVNVQFNETGRYALRLTVENPLLEGSGAGVQLQLNEGDPVYTNTATTDTIEQRSLNEVYAFEKRRFLFTLPKGKKRDVGEEKYGGSLGPFPGDRGSVPPPLLEHHGQP